MHKMKKRGQTEISVEIIIQLFLLLIVIASFIGVSFIIKGNKLHLVRVEARDYAFAFDAASSYQDSINYIYQPKENITINFNQENCLVQAKHKDVASTINFFCGTDKFSNIQVINNQGKIKITR